MTSPRNLLLMSTSTVHGTDYLQYAADHICSFLKRFKVSKILFLPYALSHHDEYTDRVKKAFVEWGYEVESIHKSEDPILAVNTAEAIFIGGGNSFLLLKSLYDKNIIEPIRERVLKHGTPYIGSSAGTNVATVNICTTNDMPIIYPPSLKALDLVPFNINPHYLDPDPSSTHMGETREERIRQYHEIEGMPTVVGLREGSILLVNGNEIKLIGPHSVRIFKPNEAPKEYTANENLNFLLSHDSMFPKN